MKTYKSLLLVISLLAVMLLNACNASAERFVIKEIMPAEGIGGEDNRILIDEVDGSLKVMAERAGYRLQLSLSFGHGFTGGASPSYWYAGAEHVLHGKITLEGYTFESDPRYPLTFKLIRDVGYAYLCGRGTVTDQAGTSHRLGYEDTVDTWLPRLTSEDQLDREGAAQALGRLATTDQDKDKVVPALIEALKDEAMQVRRNAAESLGLLKDQRAVEPLREALFDTSKWVTEVVAEALEQIDTQ